MVVRVVRRKSKVSEKYIVSIFEMKNKPSKKRAAAGDKLNLAFSACHLLGDNNTNFQMKQASTVYDRYVNLILNRDSQGFIVANSLNTGRIDGKSRGRK
jgi:hypothetical protein